MYDTIFFFPSIPSVPSVPVQNPQTPSLLTGFLLGLVSAVIINIIAGWISYFFQGKSKVRDAADASKSMLVYVHMVLCLQRSKLANIQKIFESHEVIKQGKLNLQTYVITRLAVSIKEEYLQKILTYSDFGKSKAYPATFQCIVEAESLYQKCLTFVSEFNEAIDEDRFLNADDKRRDIFFQKLDSALGGIRLSCEEAITVNGSAREKTIAIANEVFGVENLTLPIIEEKVIKSTEL